MTALSNEHSSSSSSNSFSSLPAPSSSRTSLNIDTAHMHKPSPATRHIRFAPLLDPRRAVVVTDDGHELPIKDDTHFPAAASLSVLQNVTLTSQTQKQAVTSCSDPDPPPEHSTSGSPSSSSAFSSPTDLQTSSSSTPYSPAPQSRTFTVDILKPAPGSTKQKRKSKSLSISPEEILTLGTINLFRSSTLSSDQDNFKENNDPASTSSSHRSSLIGGWGILRRTSGNPSSSANAQKGTEILGSSPLTRLQGVQEGPDRKKRRSSIAAFFSAAPGVSSLVEKTKSQRAKAKNIPSNVSLSPSVSGTSSPSGSTVTNRRPATPTHTSVLPSSQRTPRHKGARMLNGRIYGAKPNNRISENPFANARDDEPEFVEWGYGGMGSVKGARSAGVVGTNGRGAVNWDRLLGGSEVSGQGGHTGFMVPGGGRGGAGSRRRQEKEESRERRSVEIDEGQKGGEDGEEDDGSGLAWIRKRRKMREEKEKRLKEIEQAHEKTTGSESIPTSPAGVGPQVNSATETTTTTTTTTASIHDRNLSHPGPGNVGQNGVDEHRHANSSQDPGMSNANGHHDHVMKAVSVPMPRMKVSSHHRRTPSRGMPQDEEAGNEATVATVGDHDKGKLEDVSQRESQTRTAGSESSSSASSSSSSESSGEESDSDGEDSGEDQDENENENEKRRTAIGAGVEKVTASFRHRGE